MNAPIPYRTVVAEGDQPCRPGFSCLCYWLPPYEITWKRGDPLADLPVAPPWTSGGDRL